MAVLRIVPNVASSDPVRARSFYEELFDLEVAMDLGWIMTFASNAVAKPQISIAVEAFPISLLRSMTSMKSIDVQQLTVSRSAMESPMSHGVSGASTSAIPLGKP
jgi:hypothetical protein